MSRDIRNRLLIGIGTGILCGTILDFMKTWCFAKLDDNEYEPLYTFLIPFPWPILFLIVVVVPLLIYFLFFKKQRYRQHIILLTYATVLSMIITTILAGIYSGNEPGHTAFTISLAVIVSPVFYSLAVMLVCFLIGYVQRFVKQFLFKMEDI